VFSGGYGQVSWFATGEQRPYSAKKGAFKSPKITRPFDLSQGDWGAFELAARYSHLDLNDGGLTGGELTATTLGANWYVNNNVRFMGNIIFANTDENSVTPNDDPTVYIMRSQVKF
jgi:phosphate-selective porin OprO/OprP